MLPRSVIGPYAVACTLMVFMIAGALLHGCAGFNPPPVNESFFRGRTVDQEENGIRVSATVLDAVESETVFGLPLYEKGIQPVWLEIENKTEHRMWFAPVSVDRDYFSPMEVSYLHHSGYAGTAREQMDRMFHRHAIRSNIGGRYRHSPVSALYVFSRRQDAALQKARGTIHERNHLRLWLAPATFQGKPVWVGQISRDIGVRFSKRTIVTCFAKRVTVVQSRQRLDQSMLAVTAKPSFSNAFRILPVLHADNRK